MSGIIQQKGINPGAKLTGKIAGGIFFVGNTTISTAFGGGGNWVRIGAGNAAHPLFSLEPIQPVSAPSSTGTNDYFELVGATTAVQQLWYRYGKRAVHYCSYSLSLMDSAANPPATGVLMSARVVGVDLTGATTIISQSVRTFTCFAQSSPVSHTFPVVVPTAQAFYLELNNIDGAAGARNPIVREAFLQIYE